MLPTSDPERNSGPQPSMDELRIARAGLMRVAEPPAPALVTFIAENGPLAAWQRICTGDVPSVLQRCVTARCAGREPKELRQQAISDLRESTRCGARLLIPEDEEWPDATMIGFSMVNRPHLPAPLGLYLRGAALPADQRGVVTVIGSRACTAYGRRFGGELAGDLAAAGCLVVSGAAFGVDAAAHHGAIQAAGPAATVAVLACGIDRVYPIANRELIDRIARGGGSVVSEYPPGTTPARHRFLVRNRLIAALGAITVVVEAGPRSGTISTANAARDLNRVVMAVPGPVTSALSVGCHELLRTEGVLLAANARDVLEVLGTHELSARPATPIRPTDRLSGDSAKVYEALPARGSTTVREIAGESGVPGTEVMVALAELELQRMVERDGGTWRRITH